jgi:hypothetical protein
MNFELLYELEAKITKSVEIGGGFGAGRTDFHLEGRVQGKVNGSYEGIDYGSMIRTDAGEAVYVHVHETIRTGGGIVSALRRGYAIPSKEGGYDVRAFVLFQTGIPELRFLNWTLGYAEGRAGPEGLRLRIYAVR